MNKQIVYIAQAQVILAGILIGYSVFSKVPASLWKEEASIGCATVASTANGFKYSEAAQQGKGLFQSKCAACHSLFKDIQGPSLFAAMKSEQWKDRKKLYEWIRNPAAFMEKDTYTRQLKEQFGSMMTAFPNITDQEIDMIVAYIEESGRDK